MKRTSGFFVLHNVLGDGNVGVKGVGRSARRGPREAYRAALLVGGVEIPREIRWLLDQEVDRRPVVAVRVEGHADVLAPILVTGLADSQLRGHSAWC